MFMYLTSVSISLGVRNNEKRLKLKVQRLTASMLYVMV
jgi:hypothetical protein